jgi:hypothetical protein
MQTTQCLAGPYQVAQTWGRRCNVGALGGFPSDIPRLQLEDELFQQAGRDVMTDIPYTRRRD